MGKAKVRRLYVQAALALPSSRVALEPEIDSLWNKIKLPEEKPGYVAVIRWKNRYVESGNDIHALADRNASKGNRTHRYPTEVTETCLRAINTKYLTRERKTIQDTQDYARLLVRQENKIRPMGAALPIPSRRYVTHLISQIPAFERYAARHGHDAAVKRFRYVGGGKPSSEPLQRAEIDHTILDLFVIDDVSLLPLGRPYVTCCIDAYTRCILGINIGFTPPSYYTVACCLKHAFMPKHNLKKEYPELHHEWVPFGVVIELVVDNGVEFHSKSLKEACYSLGVELHYAPRKTPWFKGIIERFFRTLNNGVAHGVPGTTFSNIIDRDDYDPSQHAVVTISRLMKIVYKWVVDYYHQKEHRALGMSPIQMWQSSVTPDTIRFPADPTSLDVIMGRQYERVLTHKGIEFERLLYNSPELAALARKFDHGETVDLRVNENDLGHIYVIHPRVKEPLKVPALRADYASGLTLWQHKVVRRYQLMHRHMSDNADGWLQAKEEIAQIIANDLGLKRKRSRKRIARYTNSGRPAPSPQPPMLPAASPPNRVTEPSVELLGMENDEDVAPFEAIIQERNQE